MQRIKNFILAYWYEPEISGFAGWNVALTFNQAFANYACMKEEKTASAFDKAFETDENGYDASVSFITAIQRCPSLFASLTVATRDLEEGEELMVDYNLFRDVVVVDQIALDVVYEGAPSCHYQSDYGIIIFLKKNISYLVKFYL